MAFAFSLLTVDPVESHAERVLAPLSSFYVEAPSRTRTRSSAESPEMKPLNMLDMFSFC